MSCCFSFSDKSCRCLGQELVIGLRRELFSSILDSVEDYSLYLDLDCANSR